MHVFVGTCFVWVGFAFFLFQASSALSAGLAQDHKQGYFKKLFLTCSGND